MELQQAFSVVENALNMANQKGAFALADSVLIVQALNTLRGLDELSKVETTAPKEEASNRVPKLTKVTSKKTTK